MFRYPQTKISGLKLVLVISLPCIYLHVPFADIWLCSPNKILRSLPALDAKEIIALTVLIVRKIPDNLYEELVTHAQ